MKITIYELLGLVKDGKAPKKIKLRNEIYEYKNNTEGNFIDYAGIEKETNAIFYLSSHIGNNYINDIFTDEVEIIEEDKKIEKIEIVNNGNMNAYAIYSADGTKCALTKHSKVMCDKINELIDKVNSLKNKK